MSPISRPGTERSSTFEFGSKMFASMPERSTCSLLTVEGSCETTLPSGLITSTASTSMPP